MDPLNTIEEPSSQWCIQEHSEEANTSNNVNSGHEPLSKISLLKIILKHHDKTFLLLAGKAEVTF